MWKKPAIIGIIILSLIIAILYERNNRKELIQLTSELHKSTDAFNHTESDLITVQKELKETQAALGEKVRELETIKQTVAQQITQVEKSFEGKLDSISEKFKEDDLLKAAKNAERDDSILANLYYKAAISRLKDKSAAFREYIGWLKDTIQKDIMNGEFELAESRVAELAKLMDDNLYRGDTESIASYGVLAKEIKDLAQKVADAQNEDEKQQVAEIDGIVAENASFSPTYFEKYTLAKQRLNKMKILPVLEDKLNDAIQHIDKMINGVMACQMDDRSDFLIPPADIENVLVYWLPKAKNRLQASNIPLSQRIIEYEQITAFVDKTDGKGQQIAKQAMEEVKKVGEDLAVEDWSERSEAVFKDAGSAKNSMETLIPAITNLINQGDSVYILRPEKARTILKVLGERLYKERLGQVLRDLKKIDATKFDNQIKMQGVLGSQGQTLQLLLEANNFSERYSLSKEFQPLLDDFEVKIGEQTKLAESYRFGVEKSQKVQQEQVDKEFKNWAADQINKAVSLYDDAQHHVKEKYTNFWTDPIPQKRLKEALMTIYQIDRNDLSRVDPGVYDTWCKLEGDCKKEYTAKDASALYGNAAKKSSRDFEKK